MPIKRRLTNAPEPPKPKHVKVALPDPEPLEAAEDTTPEPPRPKRDLKPLRNVKRRFGRYIYLDENETLVVRTPSRCTFWHNGFRIHVVSGYLKPDTLLDVSAAQRRTQEQGQVYKVEGRQVVFKQIFNPIENMRSKVILKANLVVDLTKKKAVVLDSPDPAMRMLTVYAFLTGEDINGLPAYTTLDWTSPERKHNGSE